MQQDTVEHAYSNQVGTEIFDSYKGCNCANVTESLNLWPHLGDGVY